MDFDFQKNDLGPCITEYIIPQDVNFSFIDLINEIPNNLWQSAEIAKNNYNDGFRICEICFISAHANKNFSFKKIDNLIFHIFKKGYLRLFRL